MEEEKASRATFPDESDPQSSSEGGLFPTKDESKPTLDPSQMTTAQLFKAVKCDSKRSQSDWEAAYAQRKRARIDDEV